MNRCVVAVSLVVVLGFSAVAAAQTGAGSLRGYIKERVRPWHRDGFRSWTNRKRSRRMP